MVPVVVVVVVVIVVVDSERRKWKRQLMNDNGCGLHQQLQFHSSSSRGLVCTGYSSAYLAISFTRSLRRVIASVSFRPLNFAATVTSSAAACKDEEEEEAAVEEPFPLPLSLLDCCCCCCGCTVVVFAILGFTTARAASRVPNAACFEEKNIYMGSGASQ